jgi:murein DD-endopeptidase MepM/ murein hydrolase activator NlpD
MYSGPALYKGKVGSTGVSSGPHAHFELRKDGKLIPFSTARTDIGQYLQFRLPGKDDWQSFYSKQGEEFVLNPAATLTSPMGMRRHPVHGDMREHRGEDYGLPEGTQLRFLGQGSVATHSNLGGAGNVSSLRTGPYELQTFHLSELPNAATTRGKETPGTTTVTDTAKPEEKENAKDFLNAYINDYVEAGLLQGLLMPQPKADPMTKFQQMYQQFVQPGVVNSLFS